MSILSKILDFVSRISIQCNPTGTLIPYLGETIPIGYLKCDGSAISRTTYAKLFRAIGTIYGNGDSSTTFNLPDFNNKTFWGADDNLGTVFTSGLPNITGNTAARYRSDLGGATGPFYTKSTSKTVKDINTTNNNIDVLDFSASRSSGIYGASNIVQPPAIATNILIKY